MLARVWNGLGPRIRGALILGACAGVYFLVRTIIKAVF